MRVHYLQHVPFEGPAGIAAWAASRGYPLSATRLYAGEALPNPDDIDFLVIMGGPMGVHDELDYPWLRAEKQFVAAFVASGKPMLGVCLGAQLLATVLGASVTRNPRREIGWFDIERLPTAERSDLGRELPMRQCVFHWHGDTFSLPDGAVALYRSEACENQAFIWRERVLGLQFHIETTPESAAELVAHGRGELWLEPWVQGELEILRADAPYAAINDMLRDVLDRLIGAAGPN
ncbi:MAG: type 1 glutamine amidotransferase [Thiotrichales bacterium]